MSRTPPQPGKRRAIIIGGSIAGLFVGAFLRRIGWQVDICERSSIELIGRGVGIFATHLESFEALDKCGAGTVDIGVIVYKRIEMEPIITRPGQPLEPIFVALTGKRLDRLLIQGSIARKEMLDLAIKHRACRH